ncbi:ExbD/TolR family protein [Dyadobacter psychrotolerans]|uniref:Biopolymer transporter ExbD n=1 Tax=Dyadobacter psychrotolerans TaxID=2541721 RepID=A0A4V2Z4L6_9BACT|nr:biopolymer transporter ExbD [Dyadobacter psychrotolerans]TDE17148.1 biopolymer transporter ExbD [Dyadobacter psychrotolerans]
MAAIEESGNDIVKVRDKKISTRIDMTPMVDLGFLLITFFMLATTMTKPTVMSVFFPAKQDDGTTDLKASGVLTLFLGGNDDIYYLDGIAANDDKALSSLKTTRPGDALRTLIFASQRRVSSVRNVQGNEALTVVIKPTAVSSYKNMVDVMDEMAITKSTRYALVDELTESEKKILGDRIVERK